eukprot:CAMPEP_0194356244 /NCGR_PEP_ID=MMETSP0174-20130528/3957_1 /TAXON_ID=216777 /ORGANISM="Proboscia alata, Strain PI-D3" /LENGTH=808 /DNA_ID=CAMNT_0039125775 /DNA_START=161 /DNA_END=2587 /DNA_ORIENTATION=-
MTLPNIRDGEPSSILHELARNIRNATTSKQATARYNEILNRISTYPLDMKYQCPTDGSTALHWIVVTHHNQNITSPPLAIVHAAIDAYPGSLTVKDFNGCTPYDLAVHSGSKVARNNKEQYENMVSLLEQRKKELVRDALDNLFAVRDNVETLDSKFVQLKRENSTLSSQIDYVMETCTIFQKENSELKNIMKKIVEENEQARKTAAEEKKMLLAGQNRGKKETEALNSLVTDVGGLHEEVRENVSALREEVHELRLDLEQRKQQDKVKPPNVSHDTQLDLSPRRRNNPSVSESPGKFSWINQENSQMMKDLSSQVKLIDSRMDDLEEERDDADMQRRELYDKMQKVTNRQDIVEEIIENNERNSDNSQRQAKYELSMLEKEVEAAMEHNKGLERTVDYLKAERLILLRGSKNDADTKTDSQGFYIAPTSNTGGSTYRGFEVEMLHDKVELLERVMEQTQTDIDEIKTQNELSFRHTSENDVICTEARNDAQEEQGIDDTKHEKEQDRLQQLENTNRTIQQEISYLRAERLVLMNYRHGSEMQRKRDWDDLQKIQNSVEQLEESFDKIEQRIKRRYLRKKAKKAGDDAMESDRTLDASIISGCESITSEATQETIRTARSTFSLPININKEKALNMTSPFGSSTSVVSSVRWIDDANDIESDMDGDVSELDDATYKSEMVMNVSTEGSRDSIITQKVDNDGNNNSKGSTRKFPKDKKKEGRSSKLKKLKSKREKLRRQNGEVFPLLNYYLKRGSSRGNKENDKTSLSGENILKLSSSMDESNITYGAPKRTKYSLMSRKKRNNSEAPE